MTTIHQHHPFVPRGSLGKDKGVKTTHVDGLVVDKVQRNAIAKFSKDTHFNFTGYPKRAQTTHEAFYPKKDNSINLARQKETKDRTSTMKASHFNIGKPGGDMIQPKP